MIDFELLAKDLGPDPNVVVAPVESEGYEPDFADTMAEAHRREEGFEAVPELPPIVDAVDLVAEDLPAPVEIVKGLIHQGTKVVVGGGSKSFKTWTLLDLAISVSYGLNWMGFECVPGRVLYVNMEIHKTFFQKRLAKICESKGVTQVSDRLDIWNLRGHTAGYRILIPQIIKRIKESGYSIVILDPIYKVYGNTDENSASEVGQLLNELERICVETGSAIAFGAHYSKGNQAGKESIDRISGSGVFARDPDTILPFTKHEEEDAFVVEPILRNLPPIRPFVIRWNFPLMERDDQADPSKLKQAGGRPKEHSPDTLLSVLNDGPLEVKIWEEKALKIHQISRSSFFRLKSELKSQNRIFYSVVSETWQKITK